MRITRSNSRLTIPIHTNSARRSTAGLAISPKAAADAKKAVDLMPGNSVLRLNYAYALARVGDYTGAQRELDAAQEHGQKSAWFYNNLAWLLATANDDKVRDGHRAEEAMKEALEMMPNRTLAPRYPGRGLRRARPLRGSGAVGNAFSQRQGAHHRTTQTGRETSRPLQKRSAVSTTPGRLGKVSQPPKKCQT